MGDIQNLVSGIETRVGSVLGSEYKPLGHTYEVERNAFKGASKRYGVIAENIDQTESSGVLGSFTVTQSFVIKITNKFSSSQISDVSKKTVAMELNEQCLLIYKDLINTKAGSLSIVLNVLDGMSSETNFYEEDYVAEATMSIQILYRNQL